MSKQPYYLDPSVSLRRLTPENDGNHYFFGYYDIPAFSGDGRFHLANRVSFMNRLPDPESVNTLGVLDRSSGTCSFTPLAETKAWNFQQGSMLQWYPEGSTEQVLYNDWDGSDYRTVIQNLQCGEKRFIPRPVANVSPDGRWGLSINFNRLWDFRPGYGYGNRHDRWFYDPQPRDDGIWLVNMRTAEFQLLISYEKIARLFNQEKDLSQKKLLVNHLTFNRTSDRFLFLVRYFPEPGGHWLTALGTADLHGHIYALRPYIYASHYNWRDHRVILFHTDVGEGKGLYTLSDQSQAYTRFDEACFKEDIHCSYDPTRQWIIGDGYPDPEGYRAVFLYHIDTKKVLKIGRFLSPPVPVTDIRCDLHIRWHPGGHLASFDSIHEGFRGIYEMDLSSYTKK